MRLGSGVWLGIAVAAQVTAPLAALGFQTTVAGRPVDLDVAFMVREVVEQNRSTTHERTLEQLRLGLGITFVDWLRFDSTTIGTHGGPTLSSDPSGIYNIDDVFQSRSWGLEFDEVFFDLRLASVDVRLGKQKVAWGKLDRFPPIDLINPYTYNDPFLLDEAERKIGVPALQASYYVPEHWGVPSESRVTLVWVPKYVPFRFPPSQCVVVNGMSQCTIERWFPPAGVPDTTFDVPAGTLGDNPAFTVPVGFRTQNIDPPAFTLANSNVGLRFSALLRDIDVAVYYFHGFDAQPAFLLTAEALGLPDPMSPIGVSDLSAQTTLSPHFQRVHAWGADFQYAFGDFAVRGEAAYIHDRPYSRDLRDLVTDPRTLAPEIARALAQLARGAGSAPVALPSSFAVRDGVEWGLGLDYLVEGYLLLLQVNQTDVIDNDVPLLINDVETRLVANLRKNFFSDTLQTQIVGLYGIESDYSLFRPIVAYKVTDHLAVEAGYLFIAGRSQSVIGQYKANKQAWFQAEYRL